MTRSLYRRLIGGVLITTGLLLVVTIVSTASCKNENSSTIMMLVDLSGTWFSARNEATNRELFVKVGRGVVEAAGQFPRPIDIRYLKIGRNSYLAAPLCDVRYIPKMFAGSCDKKGKTIYKKDHAQCGLTGYVIEDCVESILHRKGEALTDISGAFATAAKFAQSQGYKKKAIVVMSDMIEERKGPAIKHPDLKGFHVIILYRHLSNNAPDETDENLVYWDKWLKEAGVARVTILPGLASSADLLTRHLLEDVEE